MNTNIKTTPTTPVAVPVATPAVVKIINMAELVDVLKAVHPGNSFATITATTVPSKMRKTGNPNWGNCFKTTTVNVGIQFNYEAGVNRQREREDKPTDFVADAPTWGEHIDNTCLVEHKGEFYMYVRILKSLGYRYHNAKGDTIPNEQVHAFMPPSKPSDKQDLDAEIIVRKYFLKNIRQITVSGATYQII